jgi:DNA gyrase subunit A
MIKRTADLVNDKKIRNCKYSMNQIEMVCVSFILETWCYPNVVLNTLYKYTNYSLLLSVYCIGKGRPQMLNLKDMIHYFVEHRHDVDL